MSVTKTLQSGSKVAILAGLMAAAVGTQVRELVRSRPSKAVDKPPAIVELAMVAVTSSQRLVGDARLGAQLYRINCVSCHGFSGQGDGPATAYLHPVARDHTSAYMATRTDEQLYATIDGGGEKTNLSSLMPSFSDHFDDLEKWCLVAYLRTLHPHVEALVPAGTKLELEPVTVSPDGAAHVAATGPKLGEDLRVELVRVYSSAPAGEHLVATLGAEHVPDAASPLWVVERRDPSGATTARVLPEREVRSSTGEVFPNLLDRAVANDPVLATLVLPAEIATLVSSVQLTAARLDARIGAALDQREADVREATDLFTRWNASPSELTPVQRTFFQNCATCHGVTGKGIGPNVTAHLAVRPRDFSDGSYLNGLPDEHLASMIQFGGGPMRHSGLMPGFGNGSLIEPEIQELVRYIRSLAIPPYVPGVAHAHH